MEDYKPNSHKSKNQSDHEKKVEKIVSGQVKAKKKSEVRKLADVFIQEDVDNVKTYILMDVLVPAVKKAISDIVTNGIDMVLYGESRDRKKNHASSKVSYRSYYDRKDSDRERHSNSRVGRGYDYDDIILDNRGEAEEVLARLDDLIDTYEVVSVADLYDLVGISCNYTDNKYGWTNIRNASVVRVKDGYMIKMPKARPLD